MAQILAAVNRALAVPATTLSGSSLSEEVGRRPIHRYTAWQSSTRNIAAKTSHPETSRTTEKHDQKIHDQISGPHNAETEHVKLENAGLDSKRPKCTAWKINKLAQYGTNS